MGRNGNINTMQAKEAAQNKQLTTSNVYVIIGSFALMFGAFTAFLTWNLIPGLVIGVIMGIIAYYTVVPKEINSRYFKYGLSQRHAFMSTVTQVFGEGNNSNVTVSSALRESLIGLYGEFKQNIESLISVIAENGNGRPTHKAFQEIYDKYSGDIWFTDFMEQLETTEDEGVVNADAFHTLLDNANALFDNQFKYDNQKNAEKHIFTITNLCILAALYLVPCQGFGTNNFIAIYAHAGIGWVISAIYLIYMFFCYHLMYKYYYDVSITSVK